MKRTKNYLKTLFETGDIITETAMIDLIDTLLSDEDALQGSKLIAKSVSEGKLTDALKAKLQAVGVTVDNVTIQKTGSTLKIKPQGVGTNELKDGGVTTAKLETAEKSTTILSTLRDGVNNSYDTLKKLYDYTNSQLQLKGNTEILPLTASTTLLPNKNYVTNATSSINLTFRDGAKMGDTVLIYIADASSDIFILGSDGKKPSDNTKISDTYRHGSAKVPDKINGFSRFTVLRFYWNGLKWEVHKLANPLIADGQTLTTLQSNDNTALSIANDAITEAKIDNSTYATVTQAKQGTLLKKIINPYTLQEAIDAHKRLLINAATSDYNTLGKIERKVKANLADITSLKALGSVKYTVANISDRSKISGLKNGDLVFVTDASADNTVTSGWAIYRFYNNAWAKIAEQESLDVVFSPKVDGATINTDGKGQLEVMDGGIKTIKIANDAVTSTKIPNANILKRHLGANAVSTDKIENLAVTEAKLSNDVKNKIASKTPHPLPHYDWHRDIKYDGRRNLDFVGVNYYSHFNYYTLNQNWAYGKALEWDEGLHAGYIQSNRATGEFIFYLNNSYYDDAKLKKDLQHGNAEVLELYDRNLRVVARINCDAHDATNTGYKVKSFKGLKTYSTSKYLIVRVYVELDITDNNSFKLKLTNDSPNSSLIQQGVLSLSFIQYRYYPTIDIVTDIPLFYENYVRQGQIAQVSSNISKSTTQIPSMDVIDYLLKFSSNTVGRFSSGNRTKSGLYKIVITADTGIFRQNPAPTDYLINGLDSGTSASPTRDRIFFNGTSIANKQIVIDFSQATIFNAGEDYEGYELFIKGFMFAGDTNNNDTLGNWRWECKGGGYWLHGDTFDMHTNTWTYFKYQTGVVGKEFRLLGQSGSASATPYMYELYFDYILVKK